MFIYIFDDGAIVKSEDAPFPEDFDCIKNGVLTVLKTDRDDVVEIDHDGDEDSLPEAMCDENKTFHFSE